MKKASWFTVASRTEVVTFAGPIALQLCILENTVLTVKRLMLKDCCMFPCREMSFSSLEITPNQHTDNLAAGDAIRGPQRRSGGYHQLNRAFQRSPLPQFLDTMTEGGVEKAMSAEEISLLNKFLHKEVKHILDENVVITHRSQRDPNSPLFSGTTFESLKLYVVFLCG